MITTISPTHAAFPSYKLSSLRGAVVSVILCPGARRERWRGVVVRVLDPQLGGPDAVLSHHLACRRPPAWHSCTRHLCFLDRFDILVPCMPLYVCGDVCTYVRGLRIQGDHP